jgi:hypothetical protein
MGTVEQGTTVGDFSDTEKHHKHSLQAKSCTSTFMAVSST